MLISLVMLLGSIATLAFAWLLWRVGRVAAQDVQRFLATARPATGTVIGLHWRSHSRIARPTFRMNCYPEIAFTLPSGQSIQGTTRLGSRQRPATIGATVDILYNPQYPQEMELASRAPFRLSVWVFRILSLFFGLAGLWVLVLWFLLFVIGQRAA